MEVCINERTINFVKEKKYNDIILEGRSYECNKISWFGRTKQII